MSSLAQLGEYAEQVGTNAVNLPNHQTLQPHVWSAGFAHPQKQTELQSFTTKPKDFKDNQTYGSKHMINQREAKFTMVTHNQWLLNGWSLNPPPWGLPILHQETHGVPNLLGETGETGDFCSFLSSKIWCFTKDSALTNQRTAKQLHQHWWFHPDGWYHDWWMSGF